MSDQILCIAAVGRSPQLCCQIDAVIFLVSGSRDVLPSTFISSFVSETFSTSCFKNPFLTMSTISLAYWNESQTHSNSIFISDVLFVAHFWCIAGNTFNFNAGPQRQCESISMEILKTRGAASIPSSCATSFKARRAWNYRTLPTPCFFLSPVHLVLSHFVSHVFRFTVYYECFKLQTTFHNEEKIGTNVGKPGEKAEKKMIKDSLNLG